MTILNLNSVGPETSSHPWDKLWRFKEGSTVKGKVVIIADYGAFVEIEEGVEGLVTYLKCLVYTFKIAQDFVSVGDEVEAVVLTLDKESKMSLGIKQLSKDPWTDITEKYQLVQNMVE